MKVTLADIAKKTNVTVSTVQRALNDGRGVSAEKRAYIQKVAKEMGYRRNFFASTLRRGALRIAVVYPDIYSKNRFYSHFLWEGVELYKQEEDLPFLEIISFSYEDSASERPIIFENILEGKYGEVHGIVTRGSSTPAVLSYFEKFGNAEIPVILTGNDILPKNRLCCVRSYEKMAGCTAADLLLNFGALTDGSKVVVCGKFSGQNQFIAAQGFEQEIWQRAGVVDIIKVPIDVNNKIAHTSIQNVLESNPTISAIYACSIQSTVAVCEVIEEMGLSGKINIIGSDLFDFSVMALRNHLVGALIHSRPHLLSYYSIQALVKYLLNDYDKPEDTIFVPTAIVFPGNLDFHLKDIPLLRKFANVENIALYKEDKYMLL